jgi:hypothetical protein
MGRQHHQTFLSNFTIHPARLKTWKLLFCIAIAVLRATGESADGVAIPTLRASFSQVGVWGTVTFEQGSSNTSVHIKASLSVAKEKTGNYSWGIHAFPIDYSRPDNCNSKQIGRKGIINFDDKLGKLSLVKEEAVTEDTETTTLQPHTEGPEGKTKSENQSFYYPKNIFSCSGRFST